MQKRDRILEYSKTTSILLPYPYLSQLFKKSFVLPVDAAASLPSSFISKKIFCITWETYTSDESVGKHEGVFKV
jgi:hypothetical protein